MTTLSKTSFREWFRRMFRWEKSPTSYPPSGFDDEGEVTGTYNKALLDLENSTRTVGSRDLADAERRVQDGFRDAEQIIDELLRHGRKEG